MPCVSIVVPVYKAERFLNKCVDSILTQSLQDIELILVDDGSPDKSGAICDTYAEKDSRVQVIHQENAGVSSARNKGLQVATGEYIGFVDSDDWILEDMYQTLIHEAERTGANVVMCDTLTVFDDGRTEPDTIRQLPESTLLDKKHMSPELMLEFAGSACRCIYRADLIKENKILFPRGLKFSEDRVFNLYAMGQAHSVQYIKQPLYMRYVNMDSCVNSFHPDHFFHAKRAAAEIEKAIRMAWDDNENYQKTFLRHFVDLTCVAVHGIQNAGNRISFKERYEMINEICNDPDLHRALAESGHFGAYGKWIQRKHVLLLCCYRGRVKQKIVNLKELYDAEGLVGVVKKCITILKGRR